jgi:magnesium-transporting ATPase (P-type)
MFQSGRPVVARAIGDPEEDASSQKLLIFGCLCVPTLILAIILYITFALIYLVQEYDTCSERSTLWVHVLVVLLINSAQVAIQYTTNADRSRNQDVQMKNIGILLGLNVVIVIYGAAVLFGDAVCSEMKNSGLWIVANVMFWVALITSIFALVLVGVALYGYFTTGKAVIQRRRQAGQRREIRHNSMRLHNTSKLQDEDPPDILPVPTIA